MTGRHWADSDGHGNVGYVPMAITGYLEQAKLAAQRTFIPGTESAGAGQDDVATTAFFAWTKEATAGRCLDAAMAMLAMIASQAMHVTDRAAPPALQAFVADIRKIVPPVDADRVLGPELAKLADWFTGQVFEV
jgi:histidine ammonia-lyase